MTNRDTDYTEDSFFYELEHSVAKWGHCSHDDYEPRNETESTDAAPGTEKKVEILAERLRNGQELFAEGDRCDYDGLTAAVKPTHHRAERAQTHHLREYEHNGRGRFIRVND